MMLFTYWKGFHCHVTAPKELKNVCTSFLVHVPYNIQRYFPDSERTSFLFADRDVSEGRYTLVPAGLG